MSLTKISATAANTVPESSHESSDNNAINETNSYCSNDSDNTTQTITDLPDLNENEIPSFAVRMLNFCRELAIVCLLMITYAALTKDPPKVSKAPPAYPFFPENSIVTDWYRGQISKAIEQARSSDIAFVMFYAPWDAECQVARQEFEEAAGFMSNYVTFAAVNCWQPNSECRNQYSKVYRWPVLIAYPSHGRGIQYNGPISAPHMIKFLWKVCNPFLRLSDEHPLEFQDAYIVAKLKTSPKSVDFAVFYTTALKYLEKDPLQSITFYVDPAHVSAPQLHLHLWNETLIYPVEEKEWRPDEILQWIFKEFHHTTAWVSPVGSKSLILSNSLQEGPSLILFTPKNPLQHTPDYYKMLQEVAYEYYSCEDNLITSLHNINAKLQRSASILRYNKLKTTCRDKVFKNAKVNARLDSLLWSNHTYCKQKGNEQNCAFPDMKISDLCMHILPESCVDFLPALPDQFDRICDTTSYKTSMLTGENDPRSTSNLLKVWYKENCRNFLYAEKFQTAVFEKKLEEEKNHQNISGLACRTNKSLNFVAMDSLLHYYFAERLGIDLTANGDKSAIAIINEEMESHYIMQTPINTVNLINFIKEFDKNELPRSLNSITTLKTRNLPSKHLHIVETNKSKIFVRELDTYTFLSFVLQEDKAVIVFYYSKQCAFCSGISYTFLTVAKKLSLVNDLLFARVDGETNILPWEYTMEGYPTILFFPAKEKSESRVFPSNIAVTVPNLVGFILTNLDPGRKLYAMWSVCNQTKFQKEKSKCYNTLQTETLKIIDKTLRDWRRANKRERQYLLYSLKQLRQLHLLFLHSPQRRSPIEISLKKLNSGAARSKDYKLKDEL